LLETDDRFCRARPPPNQAPVIAKMACRLYLIAAHAPASFLSQKALAFEFGGRLD
jgi:hypothetical protein